MIGYPATQFASAIRATGLQSPGTVEDDGKLHRFASDGKRGDDSGWYVYYADGIPAGSFGDWRTQRVRARRALRRSLITGKKREAGGAAAAD